MSQVAQGGFASEPLERDLSTPVSFTNQSTSLCRGMAVAPLTTNPSMKSQTSHRILRRKICSPVIRVHLRYAEGGESAKDSRIPSPNPPDFCARFPSRLLPY